MAKYIHTGRGFLQGLPARDLDDIELDGPQRAELMLAVGLGLYYLEGTEPPAVDLDGDGPAPQPHPEAGAEQPQPEAEPEQPQRASRRRGGP